MKKIEFVKLKNTKSISTTKNQCFLNCKHCNRHYLENMKNINDIKKLAESGVKSFLISGGMNSNIEVPIIEFYNKLKELKDQFNLKYNIHTGIIKNEDEYISKLKILHDSISFDIVGNEKTYKYVYENSKYNNMVNSFNLLIDNNFIVKPHITIGLDGGKISHEYDSLNIIKNKIDKIDEIIFIVFIPTINTFFSNKNPPSLLEVENIFKIYRKEFPELKLTLGCMQPKGLYRKNLQEISLKYIDKIVQPLKNTIDIANSKKFDIKYSFECCAL